ncbi:MAG: histidine phosphatase family protein [Cyanobacteria bacterium P01_A01_bin.135]
MATRIILVRHGESTFNTQRRVQGHCDDSVLTEAGRIAARQVGSAIADLPVQQVYSSPLRRAKATAELILEILPDQPSLQSSPLLLEVNLPAWERLTFDEVAQQFPEDYQLWRTHPEDLRMDIPSPEGDIEHYPVRSLYQQARQFWQQVLPHHDGETILVVGHSGINRALVQTALGMGPEGYNRFYISNCGISVLNLAGGLGSQAQLESLNTVSHLGQSYPPVRSGHTGPRLLLVRHGETDWNRDKRFQGQIDIPLNSNGRQQAEQCAEFLKGAQIDRAISSSMARPKETAEIILNPHVGVTLDTMDDLQEIGHGLWEGELEPDIEKNYPGLLQQWKDAPETVQMPEGETLQQVWDRAIAAWDTIVASARPGEVLLVVAHDAVNKSLLCHLSGLGPEHFWTFKQGNGAVSVIDYPNGPDGSPLLQSINITTFLGAGVLDKTAAGAL